MNFYYYIWVSIVLLIFSCGENKDSNSISEKDEAAEKRKIEQERLTNQKDSLTALLDSAEQLSKQVLTHFQFVKNDLPGKSYYHTNWNRREYVAMEDMLIAGVDSTGHLFLVSNLRGGYPDKNIHDRIEIKIDSISYPLVSDTLMGKLESHQMLLCACRWEVAVYSQENAFKAAELISINRTKPITVYFKNKKDQTTATIRLSNKEKENISDCYSLGNSIRSANTYRKMLEELKLKIPKE